MWYTRNIYIFFSQQLNMSMSDNLPERVQILGHTHIPCITVREHRIICCQIFCDFLLKSTFERIFNVMQLILVKIKWHIKWKYLIQKFHEICLSFYLKFNYCLFNPVTYWMTQSAGIESNNIITKIMLNMILGSNMAMLDFLWLYIIVYLNQNVHILCYYSFWSIYYTN